MRAEKPQTWEHILLGFFKEGFFPPHSLRERSMTRKRPSMQVLQNLDVTLAPNSSAAFLAPERHRFILTCSL